MCDFTIIATSTSDFKEQTPETWGVIENAPDDGIHAKGAPAGAFTIYIYICHNGCIRYPKDAKIRAF